MLGSDVNDFYFEVAVRVVEVCRASRGENGGLIGVEECRERVGKGRGIGGGIDVSEYVVALRGTGVGTGKLRSSLDDAVTTSFVQ